MSNDILFLMGTFALGLAAVVYFVFLPHLEGSSLDEQQPHYRSWLVKCPLCDHWAEYTPVSTDMTEMEQTGASNFTNWYRCEACAHRWQETYKR